MVNLIKIKTGLIVDISLNSCYAHSMNITAHQSQIRTIRQNDPRFTIKDKFVTAPRAGFEISHRCPENYRDLIQECIGHGWLKPVAYMTERELIFVGLSKK